MTTLADAVLSKAFSSVAKGLRPSGFEKAGKYKLYRSLDGVAWVLELQKSRDTTKTDIRYVINYGVLAPALFNGDDPRSAILSDCHWQSRVSGEDGREIWLHVSPSTTVEEVTATLEEAIAKQVLPDLSAFRSEADLVHFWLAGKNRGLTAKQRWVGLGQLLAKPGRPDEVRWVLAEIEGTEKDDWQRRLSRRQILDFAKEQGLDLDEP